MSTLFALLLPKLYALKLQILRKSVGSNFTKIRLIILELKYEVFWNIKAYQLASNYRRFKDLRG
jgi:hypothetical protein